MVQFRETIKHKNIILRSMEKPIESWENVGF